MNDRQQYQLAVLRQQNERLMATSNPNPARITAALNLAGLDGPEVDRACGVEELAVDMWEAGNAGGNTPVRNRFACIRPGCYRQIRHLPVPRAAPTSLGMKISPWGDWGSRPRSASLT